MKPFALHSICQRLNRHVPMCCKCSTPLTVVIPKQDKRIKRKTSPTRPKRNIAKKTTKSKAAIALETVYEFLAELVTHVGPLSCEEHVNDKDFAERNIPRFFAPHVTPDGHMVLLFSVGVLLDIIPDLNSNDCLFDKQMAAKLRKVAASKRKVKWRRQVSVCSKWDLWKASVYFSFHFSTCSESDFIAVDMDTICETIRYKFEHQDWNLLNVAEMCNFQINDTHHRSKMGNLTRRVNILSRKLNEFAEKDNTFEIDRERAYLMKHFYVPLLPPTFDHVTSKPYIEFLKKVKGNQVFLGGIPIKHVSHWTFNSDLGTQYRTYEQLIRYRLKRFETKDQTKPLHNFLAFGSSTQETLTLFKRNEIKQKRRAQQEALQQQRQRVIHGGKGLAVQYQVAQLLNDEESSEDENDVKYNDEHWEDFVQQCQNVQHDTPNTMPSLPKSEPTIPPLPVTKQLSTNTVTPEIHLSTSAEECTNTLDTWEYIDAHMNTSNAITTNQSLADLFAC